tara:strand:+ start:1943 stop:2941 length:999 start_codon:yes stop_codon:yes gene_type:complete
MSKIIKVIFFTFLFFFFSILISEEYSTIVQGNDEDVSELLRKALNQSILKVLGSQRDFNLNQQTFKKLNPDRYIKEYKFINYKNEEALEVKIDLKALQEKLLRLNLGISFLKNPKVAAWIFCKSDFSSLQAAKSLEQKCKFTKKELNNIANERGITLIYPILDSQDIRLFSLENNSETESLTIFNDRYPSDGWFFCEISSINEWCFLPREIDKKSSRLDTETRYKPTVGFNILVDNLYSKQRLKPKYKSKQPYYVEISGLNKFIEHKNLEEKLQNILFISNLSLLSLRNNSATYSFYLLSEEKNLIDYLIEIDNLNFLGKEKRKVFLAYGDK